MSTIKPSKFLDFSFIDRDGLIQEIVESSINMLKPFMINHVDILLGDCECRPTPEQLNQYKMVMIEYINELTAQHACNQKLN